MKKRLKWIALALVLLGVVIYLFTSIGTSKIATDLVQAYADPNLYENAIIKVNDNETVQTKLGIIAPIEKMTIINGDVHYTNNNSTVQTTVKVMGSKGKGKMDIEANWKDDSWIYNKINIRLTDAANKKETIVIVP